MLILGIVLVGLASHVLGEEKAEYGAEADAEYAHANDVPTTTTTFPDTGCPYSFQKYEGISHPFGASVSHIYDFEQCKMWCLKMSFCAAVDFNRKTNICYMLRELLPDKVEKDPHTVHVRKIECAPPLKCWSEDKYATDESDLSVHNANTAQTACHGVCFVSQTLTKKGTMVQRGCMTITDPNMADLPLGCSVDSSLMTIVCFCDNHRCNGASIIALSSTMLYLPLDGDWKDHSSIGRDGIIPAGKNPPKFSCLDKAVNCSAIFDGSSCISINTMSQIQWGSTDYAASDFVPRLSVNLWFKRATTSNSGQIQGMFGNSMDVSEQPSWRFVAEGLDNFVGAGVSTPGNPSLDDYPWLGAANDVWHMLTMTYNGMQDETKGKFSLLQVFVDLKALKGNARSDKGQIGVRSQPVSLGCVQEMMGFIGFIDEVKIFDSVLSPYDMSALYAMRDSPYYW